MKNKSQLHILLVEIMIAVLFFGLASTVLLETFSVGYTLSRRAGAWNTALLETQNDADALARVTDDAAALAALGYTERNGLWQRETADGVTLTAALSEEKYAGGTLHRVTLTATQGETVLVTLPADHYAGEAAHE